MQLTRTGWLALLLVPTFAAAQAGELSVGFVDLQSPGPALTRNAAALAYARTLGPVTRLQPQFEGGWRDEAGHLRAPEEFSVLWYHQGDDPAAALPEAAIEDLREYVQAGGGLLLSGAAGALVTALGVESTTPRVLPPTTDAFLSGLIVPPEQREHPAFAGLDTSRTILLTSLGGNALADFYATPGPHGTLLAEGNAGLGERPLVQYAAGRGLILFVGWRLPDFTTAGDPHRPNLERLFGNLLQYLARPDTERMRLLPPPRDARYVRRAGVPFLRAEAPFILAAAERRDGPVAALLAEADAAGKAVAAGGDYVLEAASVAALGDTPVLALTYTGRPDLVAQWAADRAARREATARRERELTAGLTLLKPPVTFTPAPLRPTGPTGVERSVILARSHFMAPGAGRAAISPVYEPLQDGGFRITGSRRQLNRPIIHGLNRVWTGDVPLFRMDTLTGNGCYSGDRVFPLWGRPDGAAGNTYPSLGTLRLGVLDAAGQPRWLDDLPGTTAIFRPGYTDYLLRDEAAGWSGVLTVAPALDFHGMICRVQFDPPQRLVWQYGGVFWSPGEANHNAVTLGGNRALLTEANLPGGEVHVGWDGGGEGQVLDAPYGQQVEFRSDTPGATFGVCATWGVGACDAARAEATMRRLETPVTEGWGLAREALQRAWYDCYVGRALDPGDHLTRLLADPDQALDATLAWWDDRRAQFQVRTPDPHFDALINWARCVSEYHRFGPGLVLGAQYWHMYSHISTGWSGREWGGDHQSMGECLRLYGAMQLEDGTIPWVSPSLAAFNAEDNTPYWVDQVWRHYEWTGDRQFLRELWPVVVKAVARQRKLNDPDDDGLFRDWYEYWNCDSNGKGPQAAAPSAVAWAMLDRAARIGEALGEPAAAEYRALADRTRDRVFAELWDPAAGRLGSIGSDGLWRGHPQTWEEYLAANAGLLDAGQARSAMRWVEAHYGFEPQPGVHLLTNSDWWPIRWSTQWIPTGDTCLAALAGLRAGDADLWWPYLKTVVGSAFQSDYPGINMGIANSGAGGGDREDVDSDDPHTHVAVRGLFGIEPDLPAGRLSICPALPSDWTRASLHTPDVDLEYRREGDEAVLTIHTPTPLIKRVSAGPGGAWVQTPRETVSLVRVPLAPPPPPVEPPAQRTLLANIELPPAMRVLGGEAPAEALVPAAPDAALPAEDQARQVLLDLRDAYNLAPDALGAQSFTFDASDGPSTLAGWWGNPGYRLPTCPPVLETPGGVRFLLASRERGEPAPAGLVALSSWAPYPLPGGATVPVGLACERLYLLLLGYAHPMRNYVVNGEVVLHYQDGSRATTLLVPPYNLDCYFQHFSLQGTPVPLGEIPPGWGFVAGDLMSAHADLLPVPCDPARNLASVELRATCSEGVLGVLGMTALRAR